ncbi:MAG: ATP-dependent helicase HrpB [Gammaproteobacteria bacterium]|nr:ATP-dependent helicase HrpB [Gammaproteobacteria bacterium]
MTHLPIEPLLPELLAALAAQPCVVLEAPPGAGKTTRVPLALLNELTAPWLAGRSIIMLEPRRLAARNAAIYMASELGEEAGGRIGYRVRFDSKVGPTTRIEVVTEGILTRRLQHDPELSGVGLVIFDEFHERNLHSDLALALCLDAQQGLREDLKLLVMSATLDGGRVATLLDAPLLRSEGRSYPVAHHYLPREPEGRIPEVAAGAVRRALAEEQGDLLVFLPGAGEIRRTLERLRGEPACAAIDLYPLYGDLPHGEQERAILPSPAGRRKVVLTTNIAESSLTIEGVRVVIDAGWQRVPRFEPRSGLTRLETVRVSRASATQRAGRAGRLQPGVCYHLWSESTQQGLIPYNNPEIIEADLAPLALELAQWGVVDAGTLRWLDAPPAAALTQARQLLQQLGALDGQQRITPEGAAMARLPLHPRLAHMVLRGEALGQGALACDIAALLSEREILRGVAGERRCDFALQLEALRAHRVDGERGARRHGADGKACSAVERAARQWRHLLRLQVDNRAVAEEQVGALLALAYPDRVARRRDEGAGRYLLSNGRGAALPRECVVHAEFIVVAALDAGGAARTGEGRIFSAAAITLTQLEALFAEQLAWRDEIRWDERTQLVTARRVRALGALILEESKLTAPDSDAITTAMLQGIRQMGLEALPWDEECRQLQARVCSLRHWLPDGGWPDLSDAALLATLDEWLAPRLNGISRRDHLRRLDLKAALQPLLGWERQQQLDNLAPTHLTVPSGSRKKLHYQVDGAVPVLAVKLQELFGLAETPAIAGGRVAVVLHLLSPAQRPIQVTQDLRSFWHNTYPEVKRELKGRYPKHPWPDDPWSAVATARVKSRY